MPQQTALRKIIFREFLNFSMITTILCMILYVNSGPRAILFSVGIKAASWAGIILYFQYFRRIYATAIRNAGFRLRKIILISVVIDTLILAAGFFISHLIYVKT